MPTKSGKPASRARPKKSKRERRRAVVDLKVQYGTRAKAVPSPEHFREWVAAAATADARITVRLVGLDEGRTLNRE